MLLITFDCCCFSGVHKPHYTSICSLCSTEKIPVGVINDPGVQDDSSRKLIENTITSAIRDVRRDQALADVKEVITELDGKQALESPAVSSKEVISHAVAASILNPPAPTQYDNMFSLKDLS